jgi:hypothetical protein
MAQRSGLDLAHVGHAYGAPKDINCVEKWSRLSDEAGMNTHASVQPAVARGIRVRPAAIDDHPERAL